MIGPDFRWSELAGMVVAAGAGFVVLWLLWLAGRLMAWVVAQGGF